MELVADTVENWDSYDTVFIGYPIWWGIAAWPVDGFVTGNDFTGKTVIPFMTNGGWPGHVIEDMKANCKGAEFAHEMEIQFDSTGGAHLETPEKKIDAWIEAVKKDI